MKFGEEFAQKYDLSTLKVLGTVGEPINPEAWLWYHKYVGSENCSIVDTYWQVSHLFNAFYYNLNSVILALLQPTNFQTETGGHVMTPLPGCTPTKPGSACFPFFGVVAVILDEAGKVNQKKSSETFKLNMLTTHI